MKCIICASPVSEAKYIAIDENGEPQVICDDCYERSRIFFEEVNNSGKTKS